MARLELVVKNTEEEISDRKMLKRIEFYACNRCDHKWAETLQGMIDSPSCRKCNSPHFSVFDGKIG